MPSVSAGSMANSFTSHRAWWQITLHPSASSRRQALQPAPSQCGLSWHAVCQCQLRTVWPFARPRKDGARMISSSLKQSDPCSGFAEPGQGLLIDEPTVRQTLRRMIIRMEANHETREDMMQVALV